MNENERITRIGELLYCLCEAEHINSYLENGILINLAWIKNLSRFEIGHDQMIEMNVQEYREYAVNEISRILIEHWIQLSIFFPKYSIGLHEIEFLYTDLILDHLNGRKIIFSVNYENQSLTISQIHHEINPHNAYDVELPYQISNEN